MTSSLLAAHHDFFDEHLFISFENLISEDKLKYARDLALPKLPLHSWEKGRDLLLGKEEQKKTFTTRALANFFSDLLRIGPRALVLDQLLPSPDLIFGKEPDFYHKDEVYLRDMFSLQGINCALMLCLKGGKEESLFFPENQGFVTVIHGKCTIPCSSLLEMKNTCFLILGYGSHDTCFSIQDLDPAPHIMKEKGLAAGDCINLDKYPHLPRVH